MSDEHGGGSDTSAPGDGALSDPGVDHAAVQATVSKFLSLADGTVRLQVDVHHRDSSQALRVLCEVGAAVVVARLRDATLAPEPTTTEVAEKPEGRDALTGQILQGFYKNGFFQSPKALAALGKDYEFLQWVRHQPACWQCGVMDSKDNPIQAAHVRRVGSGAGTGTKPPFSAIPLCSTCHSIQHATGESGLAPPEWWETNAAKAREEWGHEKLRHKFGTDSVSASVSADDLFTWLKVHKLLNFVRQGLRRDIQERQRAAASGGAG